MACCVSLRLLCSAYAFEATGYHSVTFLAPLLWRFTASLCWLCKSGSHTHASTSLHLLLLCYSLLSGRVGFEPTYLIDNRFQNDPINRSGTYPALYWQPSVSRCCWYALLACFAYPRSRLANPLPTTSQHLPAYSSNHHASTFPNSTC